MFGKNKVKKQELREDGTLVVHSIWPTIQGEGPDAGLPAVFIRLAHCNLRCYFCDTEFDHGELMASGAVMHEVRELQKRFNFKLAVITGGEPLLQNILPLTEMLNCRAISVAIETAGTVSIPGLERFFQPDRSIAGNLIVCSPKTPTLNTELLPLIGAFKYLIHAAEVEQDDGLPFGSTQISGRVHPPYRLPPEDLRPIYVQPMDCGKAAVNKLNMQAAVDSSLRFGYRLGVQIHKIVGVE